jgi:hypothetical protein
MKVIALGAGAAYGFSCVRRISVRLVNMFRLRFTTDAQPCSESGQPAHSTTGRATRAVQEPARCPAISEGIPFRWFRR